MAEFRHNASRIYEAAYDQAPTASVTRAKRSAAQEVRRAAIANAAQSRVVAIGASPKAAQAAYYHGATGKGSYLQSVKAGLSADTPRVTRYPRGANKNVPLTLQSFGRSPVPPQGTGAGRGKKRIITDPGRLTVHNAMSSRIVQTKVAQVRPGHSTLAAARKAVIEVANIRQGMGLKTAPLTNLRKVQAQHDRTRAEAKSAALRFAGKVTPKGNPTAGGVNRQQLRDQVVRAIQMGRKGAALKMEARRGYNQQQGSGKPLAGSDAPRYRPHIAEGKPPARVDDPRYRPRNRVLTKAEVKVARIGLLDPRLPPDSQSQAFGRNRVQYRQIIKDRLQNTLALAQAERLSNQSKLGAARRKGPAALAAEQKRQRDNPIVVRGPDFGRGVRQSYAAQQAKPIAPPAIGDQRMNPHASFRGVDVHGNPIALGAVKTGRKPIMVERRTVAAQPKPPGSETLHHNRDQSAAVKKAWIKRRQNHGGTKK